MKRRAQHIMDATDSLEYPQKNDFPIPKSSYIVDFERNDPVVPPVQCETESLLNNAKREDYYETKVDDTWNYALLVVLYTLQGIPMGLSSSIPFLIQQKLAFISSIESANNITNSVVASSRLSYNANAIFALCSWPFSLKLLWAPVVDACFIRRFGRRKSWLVPVQASAGLLMVLGAGFVERELGLHAGYKIDDSFDVKGVTAYFFVLYFLMATQDIAVDGWAITMLSKINRGRGPVCNSIGQNIGFFLSFVGFLALNDAESSELLWRPLLGIKTSNPNEGLVSLGSFLKAMGYLMFITTIIVAIIKREIEPHVSKSNPSVEDDQAVSKSLLLNDSDPEPYHRGFNNDEEETELDASEIGLKETYHRLWCVCKLPAVQMLFVILLTYRFPTALGDNVKFLKAVEYGLSKSTTALLFPTIVLPLGILVPIIATRIWEDYPLKQFMHAYKIRVTIVPIVDCLMLMAIRSGKPQTVIGQMWFWSIIVVSTALQSIVNSLQFNAQMTFFAKRVDPDIGGSYMTLLNTAANLGGTWPASFIMLIIGFLSSDSHLCSTDTRTGVETCDHGSEPYFGLQVICSCLGCFWIWLLGKKVQELSDLPDDAWKTQILSRINEPNKSEGFEFVDVEHGGTLKTPQRDYWKNK